MIKYADLPATMGWHKDEFVYNDVDIKQILGEVSRQFDYDVEYKDPVSGHYTLSVSKSAGMSQVLNALQLAGGIHFSIKDKKIIVSQ